MSELKGLDVAEKRFKFTLPVSGIEVSMRYATRADKSAAIKAADIIPLGSPLTKDDMFELTYFSKVLEPKLTVEELTAMTDKDITAIRIVETKVNGITKEEAEVLVRDFAIALK